jgi:hypothetical protein
MRAATLRRFWSKVMDRPDGCWEWTGAQNSRGYGSVGIDGVVRSTHRVAYEMLAGPIPDELTIDHLCHRKTCCNPAHLEVVSISENVRRAWADGLCVAKAQRSQCKRGHEFNAENTYVSPQGERFCRACKLLTERARTEAKARRDVLRLLTEEAAERSA